MFHRPHLLPPWQLLTERLDYSGTTARWATTEPALVALDTAAKLTHWTERKHPQRVQVLSAVINLASADGGSDGDAVLVALHLLSNGARALAAKLGDLSNIVDDLLLGQLTIQILLSTPRAAPTYAAQLLRLTKSALLEELLTQTMLTSDPIAAIETQATSSQTCLHPSDVSARMLADLFAWAQREQIASTADLALLLEFEQAGEFGRGAGHRVARNHGLHERTVRRRRNRTLAALRSASGRYLKASA